jgi:hypothetical protein
MTLNTIIRTASCRCRFIALTADLSALTRITPGREVRQEAGPSVGARVAGWMWSGPLWSPVGGDGTVFHQEVSQGNRIRATIKVLPSALHPPSPLRMLVGLSLSNENVDNNPHRKEHQWSSRASAIMNN